VSDLAQVQGVFQDYLLRGDRAIEAHVGGSARVPPAVRLAIYGDGYASRLAEALSNNYPALAALMGEDFHALAHAYVRAHESPFFSIRFYGEHLAQFLAADPYAQVPVLAELARWEWAVTGAYDAADTPVVTHAALAAVAPEQWAQMRFNWHPSVARLQLHWNAPQIWQAVTADAERPAVVFSEVAVPWLVWRQELTTYYRSLPVAEAAVLDAARSGWPFGELCELTSEHVGADAAALTAATFLRGWVEAGLLTAVG
jgi:hypothetical protein